MSTIKEFLAGRNHIEKGSFDDISSYEALRVEHNVYVVTVVDADMGGEVPIMVTESKEVIKDKCVPSALDTRRVYKVSALFLPDNMAMVDLFGSVSIVPIDRTEEDERDLALAKLSVRERKVLGLE